jgi:hypothetical protein
MVYIWKRYLETGKIDKSTSKGDKEKLQEPFYFIGIAKLLPKIRFSDK